MWSLTNADCLAALREMEPDSVDLVLTDPPYNVGKDYGGYKDKRERPEYITWLRGVLAECGRVSRDGVVFFPGTVNLLSVSEVLNGTGLLAKRVLGWHHREFAGDLYAAGPAISWEPIIWTSKKPRPFYNKVFGNAGRDFLVVGAIRGNPFKRYHPCPKPLAVMKWLVGLFAPSGGTVLDPFAGTGTTLQAAEEMGRNSVGIELNPDYCEVVRKRMNLVTGSLFGEETP